MLASVGGGTVLLHVTSPCYSNDIFCLTVGSRVSAQAVLVPYVVVDRHMTLVAQLALSAVRYINLSELVEVVENFM